MGCVEIETHYSTIQVWIVARLDPLKYLFENPTMSGRLSRWLILLVEFDLKYVARKTIKGNALSNFCAKNPVEGECSREEFLNENILNIVLKVWKMYFYGVVN